MIRRLSQQQFNQNGCALDDASKQLKDNQEIVFWEVPAAKLSLRDGHRRRDFPALVTKATRRLVCDTFVSLFLIPLASHSHRL